MGTLVFTPGVSTLLLEPLSTSKPREALFGLKVHKNSILMLNYDKLTLWSRVEKSNLLKYLSGGVTCHGTP